MDEPLFIGVDIGGTKTAVIAGGATGGPRGRTVFPTALPSGPRPVADVLADVVKAARAFGGPIAAVGVSCGGPLDEAAGVVVAPPNLPAWRNVPVTKLLSEALGAPAFLENDANACAVAEWREGAGRGLKSVVFLTFGTGMGAGLVLDGRLWRGANGMAGEVGHWRLTEDGPVGYGKAGSFEGWCSGGGMAQGIASRQLELTQSVATGSLAGITTVQQLGDAARAGNPEALAFLEKTGTRLGRGLSLLVDVLNPEAIVLGSIFPRLEGYLRPACEAELKREALPRSLEACRILPAQLGEQIGDYAALWAARLGHETVSATGVRS